MDEEAAVVPEAAPTEAAPAPQATTGKDAEDAKVVRPPFKDPRPTVERISQLAQRVLSGDILLPKFQRDFVWPRDKVIGLLDSIARNYPIGSILLWQSRQPLASERTIAGLSIADERPDYPVNYLLDGQQRLSTICGALYWHPTSDPESLWNLVYDLRTRQFMHQHTLDDPPLSQVPLRYLSDPAAYFRRISALDDDSLKERANALFNRIQDYMIAAVTLGDMSIEDIAPIFERINSTATPLTIVDLMRAATWNPEFDLRDAIDEILAQLSVRDFGGIDRKTVLRSVSAAAGFGFAVDDMERLRSKKTNELVEVMKNVTEAAKRSVDFLTTHIRVPRPEALPYSNQFAVLTELFRRVEHPTDEQYSAIERWFWRTTLTGYFGGWNTGQMGHDYRAVKDFAEGRSEELDVPKALPRQDIWRLTQFRSNSAVSKMLALMMSYCDPLDLLTGLRIDARKSLSWSNDKEYHHFFPRAYLERSKVPPGKGNAAANIVLLTSVSNIKVRDAAPSAYLKELVDALGREELQRRLDSVLVPSDGLDAALGDDYDAFLRLRADFLQQEALKLAGEAPESATGSPAEISGEALVEDPVDSNVVDDATLD